MVLTRTLQMFSTIMIIRASCLCGTAELIIDTFNKKLLSIYDVADTVLRIQQGIREPSSYPS